MFKSGLISFEKIKIEWNRQSIFFLSILILSALLLKFYLLFRLPINQDEFSFLSTVYKYLNGVQTNSINSFHVHFFSWLSIIGNNEVDQIIAARLVMYLFFIGACFYLFLIAKYFLDTTGALFSLLCYLSFVFTVVNSSSFRHDSIALFFFLFALFHFIVRRESIAYNVVAGLAIAVAMVFTIKSAIHLPLFGSIIVANLFCSKNRYKTLKHLSGFILAFLIGFIIIQKGHSATLLGAVNEKIVLQISSAYSTFVFPDQFFPQFKIFKLLLDLDWIIWLFLLGGVISLIIDCLKNKGTLKNWYLFALLIPLFTILVYRNAFPYFYVFVIPTATICCGYLLGKLTYNIKLKNKFIGFSIVIIFGSLAFKNMVTNYSPFFSEQTNAQREIINIIHEMFPHPVPYIDGCSMVSSFPSSGFFMSSAGMEAYLKKGEPVMDTLLALKQPSFLLINVEHLNLYSDDPVKSYTGLSLMTEDWQALKSYFIPHWGNIWVAGKRFEFNQGNETHRFKIVVPGVYTMEGKQNVLIDGQLIQSGNVVRLEAGSHILKNREYAGTIFLKLGENLYKPIDNHIFERIFMGPFL